MKKIFGFCFVILFSLLFISVGCGRYDFGEQQKPQLDLTSPLGVTSKADINAPINPVVMINNNSVMTTSLSVKLSISAEDDIAVASYYVSEYPSKPELYDVYGWDSAVQPAKQFKEDSITYNLSGGNGDKTVYVWFADEAGNISEAAKATIKFYENPQVKSKFPTANDTVKFDDVVTIEFNVDIKPSTISTGTFTLKKFSPDLFIEGSVSFDATGKKATFRPKELLKPGRYEAKLSKNVQTLNGNNLIVDEVWQFDVNDVKNPIFKKTPGDYQGMSLEITIEGPSQVQGMFVQKNPSIYYTLDGSEPSPQNPSAKIYSGAFKISKSQCNKNAIKAATYLNDNTFSQTVSACYKLFWWQSVEDELDGDIKSSSMDRFGNIYAIGNFTRSTKTANLNHVAMWNRNLTQWQPLGGGINGTSFDVVAVDRLDRVYFGGKFNQAVDIDRTVVSVSNVAMWDGAKWSGMNGGVDRTVASMLIDPSNDLIAGGSFQFAGKDNLNNWKEAKYVARWNGIDWYPLPPNSTKVNGTFISVSELTLDILGNLHALQSYFAAGIGYSFLEKYLPNDPNSKYWTDDNIAEADGNGKGVVFDNANVPYLAVENGGVHSVVRWHESQKTWVQLGGAFDKTINQLANISGTIYAAGDFYSIGGKPIHDSVVKWDDPSKSWLSVRSGIVEPQVLGNQGNVFVPIVDFSVPPIKAALGKINSISFDTDGYIYVAGGFSGIGGNNKTYQLLKWGEVK